MSLYIQHKRRQKHCLARLDKRYDRLQCIDERKGICRRRLDRSDVVEDRRSRIIIANIRIEYSKHCKRRIGPELTTWTHEGAIPMLEKEFADMMKHLAKLSWPQFL